MEPDRIFGDVADLYDRRRPGLSADRVRDRARRGSRRRARRSSKRAPGTGKATAGFAAQRAPRSLRSSPTRGWPRSAVATRRTPGACASSLRASKTSSSNLRASRSGSRRSRGTGSIPSWGAARDGCGDRARWGPGADVEHAGGGPQRDPARDRSGLRAAMFPSWPRARSRTGTSGVDELGYQPLIGPGRFGAAHRGSRFPGSQRYTSLEYIELLETHSDHQSLAPGVASRRCSPTSATTIDDHGGFARLPLRDRSRDLPARADAPTRRRSAQATRRRRRSRGAMTA